LPQLEEAPLERLRLVLPQRADGAHRLRRARAALLERDAERVELLLQPADADAEDGAAARQHVERGDLLGDVERVALRQDQDAGGDLDRRRDGGDVGERQQRVGQRQVLRGRNASAAVVRVRRLVADRDHDVLHRPQRLDAGRLGRTGEVGERIGEGERAGVGEGQSELHGRTRQQERRTVQDGGPTW
jgi:hypothetical protein